MNKSTDQITEKNTETAIGPWDMHESLMIASDQFIPESPELNKGVLLYAALNLEEGSEIVTGLVKALGRVIEGIEGGGGDSALSNKLVVIKYMLNDAGTCMHKNSLAVREQLKSLPNDFRADLTEDEVIEIADGTTDMTVTNCGFALSMGIDGAACYEDVAGSNLSKRNPETGVIDKTPDGKWIKGVEYQEPSLRKVIFPGK